MKSPIIKDAHGRIRDPRGFTAIFWNFRHGDIPRAEKFCAEFGYDLDLACVGSLLAGLDHASRLDSYLLFSLSDHQYLRLGPYICTHEFPISALRVALFRLALDGWIQPIWGERTPLAADQLRSYIIPCARLTSWLQANPPIHPDTYYNPSRIEIRLDKSGKLSNQVKGLEYGRMYRNLQEINRNNSRYLFAVPVPTISAPISSISSTISNIVDPVLLTYPTYIAPTRYSTFPPLPHPISSFAESGNNINHMWILDFRCFRVFNRDLKHGGRFYWPDIGLNSTYRATIQIDGGPSRELDYKGHHVRICYHTEGLQCIHDPYDLGVPGSRDLIKLMAQVVLNTTSRQAALNVIKRENMEKSIFQSHHFSVAKLLSLFESRHSAISHKFYRGIGLQLQNIDAKIAEDILLYFVKIDRPCLPVHDSFIVKEEDVDILYAQMVESYRKILNTDMSPVISGIN